MLPISTFERFASTFCQGAKGALQETVILPTRSGSRTFFLQMDANGEGLLFVSKNHLLRDGFFLPKNPSVSSLVDCHWDGVGMEPSADVFFCAYGMVIPQYLR